MNLIESIQINGFRSCESLQLNALNNLNCFLGLNNSGKSNILRAMNLFFNGELEPGVRFLLERDGNFPAKRRKKKEVIIKLTFITKELKKLPQFKNAIGHIPDKYEITKTWGYQDPPEGIIKTKRKDQHDKALSFLKFIRFRYLTAHRDPAKIMAETEGRIRKELLRRFSSRVNKSTVTGQHSNMDNVLEILHKASNVLISPIITPLKKNSPEIRDIVLQTPKEFQDLIVSLGYSVQLTNHKFIPEELQGSGFQSHLMFRVLFFADTAYSLDFGWKVATIWAIEEPESFLHRNFEIELANFFGEISRKCSSRIQIFCTTHSDVFPQYGDNCILVKFDKDHYSQIEKTNTKDIIAKSALLGINNFVHNLHFQQNLPLLIVEGKTDKVILEKTLQLLQKDNSIQLFCNDDIDIQSGGDALLPYYKNNKQVIEHRQKPIIQILDWNVPDRKVQEYQNISSNLKAYRFDGQKSNPKLDESFTGIERYLPEYFLDKISQNDPKFSYQKDQKSDIISIKKKTLENYKVIISSYFQQNAKVFDLQYLKSEIDEILKLV
ncbi:MAG: hypothetical protein A2252_08740 [Elusimicrobia bacterium RIFOXYA2_FULL_39_19]|nr:MAG: hypothetical protein A2252_08740 [Elusimicrobia bacterium RIFOXYA2_FULL_39_19]